MAIFSCIIHSRAVRETQSNEIRDKMQIFNIKPWPKGTPNSIQLEPSSQLRWSWVSFGHPLGLSWLELDRVGSNLIKLTFSPNSSQVFHRLAISTNSCQAVLLLLCDHAVVFRQLNVFFRLGCFVWPPADASFDFVTWLELAWVGLSWEYRLAMALQRLAHKKESYDLSARS